MAMTLVQAGYLSQDVLQRGIIELFVRDDPILEKLPFVECLGNGITYNVETTEATAQFYDVGETWVESTFTTTPATAVLKILGGDADVDNYLLKTRSNINDLKQEAINAKIKALKYQFMTKFYYGYLAGNTKEFDGLHKLLNSTTYNTIAVGTNATTPGALTMLKLEEAVDKVKGFNPDLMVMSKQLRRYINRYLIAAGGVTHEDRANRRVQTIFGIPVGVSDYISDNENCNQLLGSTYGYEPTTPTAAGDGATTIFILSFDPKGCCGVQAGSMEIEEFPKLETKDASRHRIKWYASLMLQNILSCSKVTGIDVDGTVAV